MVIKYLNDFYNICIFVYGDRETTKLIWLSVWNCRLSLDLSIELKISLKSNCYSTEFALRTWFCENLKVQWIYIASYKCHKTKRLEIVVLIFRHFRGFFRFHNKISPSKHTTLFWRPSNVRKMLDRRPNNALC